MRSAVRFVLALVALTCLIGARAAYGQASERVMTDGEVEKLRAAAYIPNDRIAAFIKILDDRANQMQTLTAKRRKPGREQDLRELYEQISEIADELNDNLDDYAPKHRDIRKALPKLLEATERWATILRAPGEDPAYKVPRKLALDAIRDVHEAAQKMQTEQIAYFAAHPEAAKAEKARTSDEATPPARVCVPR